MLALGFAVWLGPVTGLAEGPQTTPQFQSGGNNPVALQQAIERLGRETDLPRHARGALGHAERALKRARQADSGGDGATALRAMRIAHAALELAERRLAQAREQAELRYTEDRSTTIKRAVEAAKQALEQERSNLTRMQARFATRQAEVGDGPPAAPAKPAKPAPSAPAATPASGEAGAPQTSSQGASRGGH